MDERAYQSFLCERPSDTVSQIWSCCAISSVAVSRVHAFSGKVLIPFTATLLLPLKQNLGNKFTTSNTEFQNNYCQTASCEPCRHYSQVCFLCFWAVKESKIYLLNIGPCTYANSLCYFYQCFAHIKEIVHPKMCHQNLLKMNSPSGHLSCIRVCFFKFAEI